MEERTLRTRLCEGSKSVRYIGGRKDNNKKEEIYYAIHRDIRSSVDTNKWANSSEIISEIGLYGEGMGTKQWLNPKSLSQREYKELPLLYIY